MINLIEVGFTGKTSPAWVSRENLVDHILSFNPLLKSFSTDKHCHLQLAITDERDCVLKDFNIYNKADCSSFFEVNEDAIKERKGKNPGDMELKKVIKVGCARLDELLDSMDVKFNYLKIDTQGADLSVIKSTGKYLKEIWVVEAEVLFTPLYKDTPMAEDILNFMLKETGGQFKLMGDLRKPNPLFGDYIFINKDIPDNIMEFVNDIYKPAEVPGIG